MQPKANSQKHRSDILFVCSYFLWPSTQYYTLKQSHVIVHTHICHYNCAFWGKMYYSKTRFDTRTRCRSSTVNVKWNKTPSWDAVEHPHPKPSSDMSYTLFLFILVAIFFHLFSFWFFLSTWIFLANIILFSAYSPRVHSIWKCNLILLPCSRVEN